VYYAKYANEYLIGKEFFQSHPPLSQYLIAFGIWVGSHFPAPPDTINTLTGSARSTFSYRWLNAFIGSFIPIVVGAIAYQLTAKRAIGIIAASLIALDGLFLVESRYALNNIYLIIFGLLGHLFFLISLKKNQKLLYLIISGIFFGLCASIKWNGLGFLLGIFILIGIAKIGRRFFARYFSDELWKQLANVKIIYIAIALLICPAIVYSILWIPHLQLNPRYNFIQVHQEIWSFHQRIQGNTPDVHPYCSPWYSWPFLWRTVAYYYAREGNRIYDVHAMGNPILWILSTAAIAFFWIRLLFAKVWRARDNFRLPIVIYLLVNYVANLLPWMKIGRCTFLYHYMTSYVFAVVALAWLIGEAWRGSSFVDRLSARVAIVLIVLAFFYWLPVYLGIPLSDGEYYRRMIFRGWI
jgi:dolichyl-phosphate-mannose--protein O-mannosyl transferase